MRTPSRIFPPHFQLFLKISGYTGNFIPDSLMQHNTRILTITESPAWKAISGSPIVIAGPCSAESEVQVMETAQALKNSGIHYFRMGLWKPRTRPNSFEGVGEAGLPWMIQAKKETGLRMITEISNARHAEAVLKAGIDAVWIGARTTVNPFTVQEIADALRGTNLPVLIKNPINPDLNLWVGAFERFHQAGITQLAACHRGFSAYVNSRFRNLPHWEIPLELKRIFPELPVITDVSHITGDAAFIPQVAQKALDIGFEGLMLEVHPHPSAALSDPEQQITPARFLEIIQELHKPKNKIEDSEILSAIALLREEIDQSDRELIQILQGRLKVAGKIGRLKQQAGISFFQQERYDEVLKKVSTYADLMKISPDLVRTLFELIHVESIEKQGE
jgi:chorismate mutase